MADLWTLLMLSCYTVYTVYRVLHSVHCATKCTLCYTVHVTVLSSYPLQVEVFNPLHSCNNSTFISALIFALHFSGAYKNAVTSALFWVCGEGFNALNYVIVHNRLLQGFSQNCFECVRRKFLLRMADWVLYQRFFALQWYIHNSQWNA